MNLSYQANQAKNCTTAARRGAWRLAWILAAGLITAACGGGKTPTNASPEPSSSPAGTTAPGSDNVAISATKVSITLPPEQSKFPPGPDMPLVEITPCLSCHDAGDVAEFQAARSPNYKLADKECTECHSADYSLYQPRLTKAEWVKVVKKMADKFDTILVNGVPTVDVMLNPVHQDLMAGYLVEINGKK